MLVGGFVITGAPAVIVILLILAVFVMGVIAFFRLTVRGAKRVADHAAGRDPAAPEDMDRR